MKKIILFLGLSSILNQFSCSKSTDTSATTISPTTNTNFIKAKIDGVDYMSTGANIMGDQNSLAFNFRSDISGGGTGFDFSINGIAAVGTYSPSYSNATTVGRLNYRLNSEIYSSAICSTSGGTLTITSKTDKTIEGTFSFTAKKVLGCSDAPKSITDGSFKVTFL